MQITKGDWYIGIATLALLIIAAMFVFFYHDDKTECGMCGARVSDVYYTMNDAHTEFIPICWRCADLIDAEG